MDEQRKQKPKHRIGTIAIILFVFFALLADIIGLIPLAKDITGTLFWGITSFILWKKGLGIFNGKKLATMAISWAAGMIPIIQELPVEITAGIVAIIFISRVEEKTGASVLPQLGKGVTPRVQGPLNQAGMRMPTTTPQPLNGDGLRAPGGGLNSA